MTDIDNTSADVSDTKTSTSDKTLDTFKEVALSTCVQKTEKLTMAMYMITNLLSDTEPLKWHMRTKALHVLSDMHVCVREDNTQICFDAIKHGIGEVTSLLGLGMTGGLVSPMNFSLLKEEYDMLHTFIDTHQAAEREREHNTFLNSIYQTSDTPHDDEMSQRHRHTNTTTSTTEQTQKKATKTTSPSHTRSRKAPSSKGHAMSKRKQRIVRLIQNKKSVKVSDLTKEIHDCSPKTLQRDLNELVDLGTLTKKGERRWRTYSLAQ